ncbi:competence pheromone ComX [Niallia endozanthoxylica]|uniref:ComX pheromone n=1 Tax=Niallia endozanthoxylica TaxID=2036016 RepID=A0A5J5HIW9_9BACI|nr:competence pheromone ComX [Niallia endozanthoxylica]KAA9020505.1 competence pheromone ComX [Niallia endozanthoxylica]
MQDIIQFLINNADVLVKVKEGTASLVGVNDEELKAIFEVFFGERISPMAYYWR